jgi:hypothetical protein
MKKTLFRFALTLVILFFLAGIAAFTAISKAPSYLSDKLSTQLKVPVHIGDISVSLNEIGVKQVEVENLPNHYLKKALSIDSISCKNELLNYLEKKISINEICLDGIYLGLEFNSPKGTEGNWTTLMDNLQSSSKENSPSKESKTVEIKQLVLRNIQVDVVYQSQGGKVKRLPLIKEIVLKNINTAEGLPADQITQSVLGQMLRSVFVQENLKNMFEGILEQPQNALDTLFQPFKGLF